MYGSVGAFHTGQDTFLVESPYADSTQLTVTALRPDGSNDPRFGSEGRAVIRAPWTGSNAALDTMVSTIEAGPKAITVIASRYGHNELQLIRVRL
jgi:hypothetical protein